MRATTPRPSVVVVSDGDGPPRLVRAEHAVKALTVRVGADGAPRLAVEWKAARPRRGGAPGKPVVRRVRTTEGARRYGQPIGAVIVVDPETGAVTRVDGGATGSSPRGRVTPEQAQAAADALGPERTQRVLGRGGRAGLSGATPAALRRLVDAASADAVDDDDDGPGKAPEGRSEWGPGRSPARATADFTFDSTAAVDARTPTNNALRHHFVNQPGYAAVDDADVDGVTYRPGDVVSYRDRDGRTAHEGRVLALRRGGPRDEVQAYVQWDADAAPDGPSGESVLPLTVDAARVTKVSDGDGGVGPDDATEGEEGAGGGGTGGEPDVPPEVANRSLTPDENRAYMNFARVIIAAVRVHDIDDAYEVSAILGAASMRDTRAVDTAFQGASDYLRAAAANSVVMAKKAEYNRQAAFLDRTQIEFRQFLNGGGQGGDGGQSRTGKARPEDVERVSASRLRSGDRVLLSGPDGRLHVYGVRDVDDTVEEGVLRLTLADTLTAGGAEHVMDIDPDEQVDRVPAGASGLGETDPTGDGDPEVTQPGPPPPAPDPEPVGPPRPPRRRTTTGGGRAGGGAPRRRGVPEGQSRPLLYTYQRRNLVALNLDADTSPSPLVREAAAAVRARRPLTAEQSTALALAVRAAANRDGVRPVQARALGRLALRLDAAAAEARGMSAGDVATRIDLSVKPKAVKPGDVGSGDRVAVAGPDGTLVQGVIRSTRSMMGGRLVEIDVEGDDGTVTRVLHTARTDAFLLPDLPDPEPVVSLPEREMIPATSVRAGDTIRVMQGGRHYDVEVESLNLEVSSLIRVGYPDPRPGRSLNAHTSFDRSALVARVSRGNPSRSQPPGIPFTEGDPVDTPWRDVRVGDRVVIAGDAIQGMVTGIEVTPASTYAPGRTRLSIADDGGSQAYLDLTGDRTVPVQSRGSAGVEAAIRAMIEAEARRADAARVAGTIRRELKRAMDRGPAADVSLARSREDALSVIDRHMRDTAWETISRRSAAVVAQDLFNGTGADEEARRQAAEEPLRAFMESALRDEFADLRRTYEAADPMPGEDDFAAIVRVTMSRLTATGSDRWENAALALIQGRDNVRQGVPMDTPPPPPPAQGGSLADRMAAYRQALGGTFGRSQQRVVTFDALDVESLRRLEVPSTVTRSVGRRGRAADGGPDETAMRHLAVVRAAGAELRAAVDGEMDAALAGVLRDNPVEGVELRDGESAAALIARVGGETEAAARALNDLDPGAERQRQRDAREAVYARYGLQGANVAVLSLTAENALGIPPAALDALGLIADSGRDEVRAALARVRAEGTAAANAAAGTGDERAVRDAFAAARVREASLKRAAAEARRRAVMLTIGSVREIGGEHLDYRAVTRGARTGRPVLGNTLTDRSRPVRGMRAAEAIYPSDWVASVRDNLRRRHGREEMGLGTTTRGYASPSGGLVMLSSHGSRRSDGGPHDHVAVHELGHHMEWAVEGLVEAEEALLWARTSTGETGSRTREAPTRLYGGGRGRRDQFRETYTGRDYGDGGTGAERGEAHEVFTTGIESLVAGSPYQDGDTDFQDWTLGVLALLGNPRPPADTVEDVTDAGQRVTLRAAPEPGPVAVGYRNPFVVDPADQDAVEQNLRDVFGFTHDKSGFTIRIYSVDSSSDRARVSFTIRDKDGNKVGDGQRSIINHGHGRVEVHHDLLTLYPEVQGQGFADAYYKHLYDQYPSMGVTHVTINANIDVGGYAWAQRGFGWNDPDMGLGDSHQARKVHARLTEGVPREVLDAATPEQRQRLDAFGETLRRARDREGPWPSPKEIANAVSDLEWEHTTRRGVKVRMWPGKWAMLGSNWHGTYYLPGNEQAMAENQARDAARRAAAGARLAARASARPMIGVGSVTIARRLREAGTPNPEAVAAEIIRRWEMREARSRAAFGDDAALQRRLASIWSGLMEEIGL